MTFIFFGNKPTAYVWSVFVKWRNDKREVIKKDMKGQNPCTGRSNGCEMWAADGSDIHHTLVKRLLLSRSPLSSSLDIWLCLIVPSSCFCPPSFFQHFISLNFVAVSFIRHISLPLCPSHLPPLFFYCRYCTVLYTMLRSLLCSMCVPVTW